MNPRKYEESRSRRAIELKNEVPRSASDICIVSAPVGLVQAGQEYLRRQRGQAVQILECKPKCGQN